MDTRVEVSNGSVKQKVEPQLWHGGEPLFERSLFPKSSRVRPVVKHDNRAIRQSRTQIPQAVQRRLINVAIDARVTKLLRQQRFGPEQALVKKSLHQFQPRPFGEPYVLAYLLQSARVLPSFPEGLIVLRMRLGQSFKTVESINPSA